MDVHVPSGVFGKDFDGALFFLGIPRPRPQQQASMVQLLLQMAGMMIADPFSDNPTEKAANASCKRLFDARRFRCPEVYFFRRQRRWWSRAHLRLRLLTLARLPLQAATCLT
jgi:hypothetical protein